jgi:outer membrane biosynthesis protein TonB
MPQPFAAALLEPITNLERRITAMRTTSRLSRMNAFGLTVCASAAFVVACSLDKPEAPTAAVTSSRPANDVGVAGNLAQKHSSTYFEFQVDNLATPLADPQLEYPPELKTAGVSGAVDAQFVVDETGRIDLSTFKVLNNANPVFITAVKSALPTWRFEPASVQGHKVKQVVQQSFGFARYRLSPANK